jgi:uncharacterized protein YndB with AHSA1/START domain
MLVDRIEREILIEAPIDVVWHVVTQPHQIAQWFSDAADIDLQPGGQGTLTFNLRATSKPASVRIQVESVEAPHRFAYRWLHPDHAIARVGNSTLVEFTLYEQGDRTRLRVVESGLLAMDWSQDAQERFVEEHTSGWEAHIASLRDYVARQQEASSSR